MFKLSIPVVDLGHEVYRWVGRVDGQSMKSDAGSLWAVPQEGPGWRGSKGAADETHRLHAANGGGIPAVTANPKHKPTATAPTREARRPVGYCLTNWVTWFEIDGSGYARKSDYRRKGGLEFVRLFVSAGGTKSTESSQFLQLLAVLRAISPERYHANVGMYFALVGLTATLQRCYRGWLLDEALRPLTQAGMALRLFVDLAAMQQAVKDLLASGLIQRQPLKEFDPGADDAPPDEPGEVQEHTGAGKATPKKPRENKGRRASSGDLRKSAEKCESLNKTQIEGRRSKSIAAAQQKVEDAAQAETVKLTCPNCGHEGRAKATGKPGQCSKCGTMVKATEPIASIPPTNADAGAGLAQTPTGVNASLHARPTSIIRLAELREIEPRKYSITANEFGKEVCTAAGYVATEGWEYVNEVAHWAKLWDSELAGMDPAAVAKIKRKLFKVAARVRAKRDHYHEPMSYLEMVLQNAIKDHRRAIMRKGAG
jgi:predicted RNA-binding Zn-ribbon protein involved in translation (DUF1610 family)